MDLKPFENCRIAVCMSGESRSFRECAESIKKFFSDNGWRGNQYYFFGHTWDANGYKIWDGPGNVTRIDAEQLDKEKTLEDLNSHFKFEKIEIEDQFIKHDFGLSTFYSRMKANFLKQKYEVENNMMFDLVIKTRFDLCYRPGVKFEDVFASLIEEKTLYSRYGFYRGEFFLPNPDEVFYFGTSLTMDIVEDLYNSISTGAFDEINRATGADNLVWHRVGPGILLHRWLALRNILPRESGHVPYAAYRKQAIDRKCDPETEFELIKQIEQGCA
jgi:hypothetical protein